MAETPQGVRVEEGHPSHELVYIMTLGVRTTVSQTTRTANTILTPDDSKEVQRWKFVADGSAKTPAHKHSDFKFQDYAPKTFQAIRSVHVSEQDYLISLTQNNVLTELHSPGKSGAFLYFTEDLRYVIKTISHAEAKHLRSILYTYYFYLQSNPNTLLSKFCGLHRLQPRKGPKVYFVVMHNVFPAWLDVHARYDLKGSTQGRTVGEQVMSMSAAHRASAVLKDLDFLSLGKVIRLGPKKSALFHAQVKRDVEFLASIKVMDYSLLLGVHDLNISNSAKLRTSLLERVTPTTPTLANRDAIRRAGLKRKERRAAKTALYKRPVLVSPLSSSDLPSLITSDPEGGAQRFTSVFSSELGGLQSTDANDNGLSELYFMGIIDFLQPYNKKKKIENKYKSLRFDGTSISAVPPTAYAKRFYEFVSSIVVQDPDPPSEVVLQQPPPSPLRAAKRNSINAALLDGGKIVSVKERLDSDGNLVRVSRIRRRRRRPRSTSVTYTPSLTPCTIRSSTSVDDTSGDNTSASYSYVTFEDGVGRHAADYWAQTPRTRQVLADNAGIDPGTMPTIFGSFRDHQPAFPSASASVSASASASASASTPASASASVLGSAAPGSAAPGPGSEPTHHTTRPKRKTKRRSKTRPEPRPKPRPKTNNQTRPGKFFTDSSSADSSSADSADSADSLVSSSSHLVDASSSSFSSSSWST